MNLHPTLFCVVVNLDPIILEKRWIDGESWPNDFVEKVNRGEDLRWVGSRCPLTHALKLLETNYMAIWASKEEYASNLECNVISRTQKQGISDQFKRVSGSIITGPTVITNEFNDFFPFFVWVCVGGGGGGGVDVGCVLGVWVGVCECRLRFSNKNSYNG